MQIFTTILRGIISVWALVAVIYIWLKEAETGQNISMWVYAILAGAVFWLNADWFVKIVSFFKKTQE